jgi:hypothetical protein
LLFILVSFSAAGDDAIEFERAASKPVLTGNHGSIRGSWPNWLCGVGVLRKFVYRGRTWFGVTKVERRRWKRVRTPEWTPTSQMLVIWLGFFGWALNSAVECHLHTVEVIGSNPIAPTIFSTAYEPLPDHLLIFQ